MQTEIHIDQRATLLFRIDQSIGSTMFRSLFATHHNEDIDVLRDGAVSCAVYVSALLVMAGWLPRMCATVSSLEETLEAAGWECASTPLPGSVIIWKTAAQRSGELHAHAGFARTEFEAVSHIDSTRSPAKHHITFGEKEDGAPVRSIKMIYVRDELVLV